MEKAILWLLRSHSISIKYTDYWIACFINDLIFFEIQHSVPFLKVTVDGLYLKGWNTKSLLPNISLCYSIYVSTSATLFFEFSESTKLLARTSVISVSAFSGELSGYWKKHESAI